MPTIAKFYGISVRMYSERGERHHVPHIHCEYGGRELIVDLDGGVLEGELPGKQTALIVAWVHLRGAELKANWDRLYRGETAEQIPPLK